MARTKDHSDSILPSGFPAPPAPPQPAPPRPATPWTGRTADCDLLDNMQMKLTKFLRGEQSPCFMDI